MKYYWLLLILPLSAHALDFSIYGKQGELIWGKSVIPILPQNVGDITIELLQKAIKEKGIREFLGSNSKLISVNDLGSDVKVINEDEIESFHWCFTINDFQPGLSPKDTIISDSKTKISWYYAFSLLKQGEWVSECVPASESKASN